MGKQLRDPLARLAVLLEAPFRADDPPLALCATATFGFDLYRLAVEGIHLRLVVERVDMAWSAIHEQEDHALGLGRVMRRLGSEWIGEGVFIRRCGVEEAVG